MADSNNLRDNLESYINAFSANAREIFEKYDFNVQIDKLNDNNLFGKKLFGHQILLE